VLTALSVTTLLPQSGFAPNMSLAIVVGIVVAAATAAFIIRGIVKSNAPTPPPAANTVVEVPPNKNPLP
jgi:hypothetical protein